MENQEREDLRAGRDCVRAIDWAVRENAPSWLSLDRLETEAAELRNLAPIVDTATAFASFDALYRISVRTHPVFDEKGNHTHAWVAVCTARTLVELYVGLGNWRSA